MNIIYGGRERIEEKVDEIERVSSRMAGLYREGSMGLVDVNSLMYELMMQYHRERRSLKQSPFCKILRRECNARVENAFDQLRHVIELKQREMSR
jgi:hypothetical protein